MHPDPAQRFQTAHEMSAELARILEQERASSADDLAAFLREVETKAPVPQGSDPTLVGSRGEDGSAPVPSDEATVREAPSD